jgi:TPR repeat protein
MGTLHLQGALGVAEDHQQAFQYFQEAAEQGKKLYIFGNIFR